MSDAWTQNFFHIAFGTKRRAPLIAPEIEPRLHSFLAGILRDLDCMALAINGTPDHVHLLVRVPAKLSQSDLVRHLKSRSSKWIHQTFPDLSGFAWQDGYGGFTVSKSLTARVSAYIVAQKTHHKRQDSCTEFLELLRKHGIEFNKSDVLK